MTLTLHVDQGAWRSGARSTLERFGDVVPVVKGNGYGFGRARLAAEVLALGQRRLAVGSVHELEVLAALPPLAEPPLVLTPALGPDVALGDHAILTVGSVDHVRAAAGRRLPVTVKLASSMRRYGVDPGGLSSLLRAVDEAGLSVDGFALHLPLAGDAAGEIEAWLAVLPPGPPLSVSHVDAATLHRLRSLHPQRRLPVRLGTALWHGDRSALALRADVIETRAAAGGSLAGYRQVRLPDGDDRDGGGGNGASVDGTVVMVGAGTAHGVHPLPDGRSPFHFARRRLALVERPHMHTSMVWVPSGAPCPKPGDEVDVQQPLTFVTPDRVLEH